MRYGMILFIASEVMFFVAWFWAFFDASDPYRRRSHSGCAWSNTPAEQWPPVGIETFDPWHLPLINTLILLTSGTTVTWAHHALQHNDRRRPEVGADLHRRARRFCSHAVQIYEYAHAAFQLLRQHLRRDLLHGDRLPRLPRSDRHHIPDGLPVPRRLAGHFKPEHHFGFEAAAWYWHFVDVVWLFLFACIYVWGGGHACGTLDHDRPGWSHPSRCNVID